MFVQPNGKWVRMGWTFASHAYVGLPAPMSWILHHQHPPICLNGRSIMMKEFMFSPCTKSASAWSVLSTCCSLSLHLSRVHSARFFRGKWSVDAGKKADHWPWACD